MAKLILLPGNGKYNQIWIESIQCELGGDIQMYRHWQTGEPIVDFDFEAQKLQQTANGGAIRVFAKSAGCLVAMKAARELGVKIECAIFVGIAIEWGEELKLPVKEWLTQWQVPTLFVHKQYDPIIALKDLKPLLMPSAPLVELTGADHDYFELDSFIPAVKAFLEIQ